MAHRLAIIIVSWNVRTLLRNCLQSLTAAVGTDCATTTIMVVDNQSHDGTPEMVRNEFPQVQLIEPQRNTGFAGGNNIGLRALGFGRHPTPVDVPEYVLLLNPDTEPAPGSIETLCRFLDGRPDLAVVGPCLRYADGSVQSSRRRNPSRMSLFWESTLLERWWPQNRWARWYHCADRPDDSPQPVDWLVGAALLVRSEAISAAGLLDERYFMYSEEQEWQQRIQQVWGGRAIVYLPTAAITHYEGRSSEQVPARRHIDFQRSKIRLARQRFGWRTAYLLRSFLRFHYGYELTIESLKLLAGHQRSLRRERIGVYWQVLRDGLLVAD
jgi:N-acetylglucosaminyl-diphospho-decaprenol L-rhamnosyltransferase